MFMTRTQAGRALALRLAQMPLPTPIVVLALPRGGVPVAAEIAREPGEDWAQVERLGGLVGASTLARIGQPEPHVVLELCIERAGTVRLAPERRAGERRADDRPVHARIAQRAEDLMLDLVQRVGPAADLPRTLFPHW